MENKLTNKLIENHPWLVEFKQKHGRMPRVLHIGNIANNAYINAKIMRNLGIEADVLCPDYYHIMGCPEWEDAEFEGDIGDQNMPDWWSVNLKGFKRPSWFLQGPSLVLLRYLESKNNKKLFYSLIYKTQINFYRWSIGSRSKRALYGKRIIKLYPFCKKKLSKYKDFSYSCRNKAIFGIRKIINLFLQLRSKLKDKFIFEIRNAINLFLQLRSKLANKRKKSTNFFLEMLWVFDFSLRILLQFKNRIFSKAQGRQTQISISSPQDNGDFNHAKVEIKKSENVVNPDIVPYLLYLELWKKILPYYDVVQGYALNGIYPLIAGITKYTAYEHGTLRDIPFVDDAQGRICKSVYKNAGIVFVTNTDCLAAAERLAIENHRIIPLPHAFDSYKVLNFYNENRKKIQIRTNPVTFIAPARHHWTSGTLSWLKGNDVIIHAANQLNKQRLNFKIIFVEWGNEVAQSKKLIAELGINHCFDWIQPVLKKQLWIYYLQSAGVIDQFVIPAMGGVCFETLALGRPLLTKLDMPILEKFFGVAPPVYNAATPEELANAMCQIINDPNDSAGIGQKAQEWIKKYHSSDVILDLQLSAYQRLAEC